MNIREKLLSGGLWSLAGKIIAIACAFLLNLILARALSPADYGVYFVVLNTIIILATVGNAGMDQIVIVFAASNLSSGNPSAVRTAIVSCIGITAAGVLLVSIGLYLSADWLFGTMMHMPQVHSIIPLILLWFVASTLQRQVAETFRGLHNIPSATMFGGLKNNGILLSAVTCLAMLVLLETGRISLWTVFIVMAYGSLFVLLCASGALLLELRRAGHAAAQPSSTNGEHLSISKALGEGWPLCLSMLLTVLSNQGSGWLAGMFDTPGHVALFGVAQRFVILLIVPMVVVYTLLPPIIVELHHRGEMKRLERVVQAVAGLSGIPCGLILLVIIVAGRPLLGFLFGAYYEAAYPVLLLLSFGQAVNIATGSWQIVLPMTGRKQQMLLLSVLSAAVFVVTGVIGGHYFGIHGIAAAFCASVAIVNLIGMFVVHRELGIWTFVHVNREMVREVLAMVRNRVRKQPPGKRADTITATK